MAGQTAEKVRTLVAPGVLHLSGGEREWVTIKWQTIREAQQKADALSNKWTKLSDELNDYLDRSHISDPLQRARIRSESLALAETFAAGKWFGEESQRHIDDLNLFLRMKELELL